MEEEMKKIGFKELKKRLGRQLVSGRFCRNNPRNYSEGERTLRLESGEYVLTKKANRAYKTFLEECKSLEEIYSEPEYKAYVKVFCV